MKLQTLAIIFTFFTINSFGQFAPGKTIEFDGVNDWINTTYSGISGTASRTIEAWIKPGPYNAAISSANQRIITDYGSTGSNGLRFTTAVQWAQRNFRSEIGGNGSQGPASMTDQKWHHVAVVLDAFATNKVTTYVDGVQDWNGNYTITANTSNLTSFRIAARIDNVNYFLGTIDEIRFWNYPKSASEIKEDMFKRVNPNATGLVAYYDFDGATNVAGGVPDLASVPHNGTMNNMLSTAIQTANDPIHWDISQTKVRGIWSVNGVGEESDGFALNATAALAIGNNSVYGHNNGTGNHLTTDIPVNVNERYDRIWSNDINGTVNANITFDLSTIEGMSITPGLPADYVLLFRSGTSGVFTNVGTASAIINTDQVQFQNISMQDGYYTLGFAGSSPILVGGNTITNGANPICANTSFTLSLNGASSLIGQTYQWESSLDNITYNPIPTANSNSLIVNNVSTSTYYHCIISLGANSATSTPLLVTINALPNVTASISAPTICIGDNVTFTGGGANIYTWTDGINTPTDATPFTPNAVSTSTYTVTGTDGNSCSATSIITLVVNALPVVTAAVSTSSICLGDFITFTGSGASTYSWTDGTNTPSDATPFTPSVASNSIYTVTGTDGNNCSATSTVSLSVNALPLVTGSVSNSTICLGDNITFTGGGANIYTWTDGINSPTDATPFTPSLASSSTYTVTGTDGNSCSATSTVLLTVNALPNISTNLISSSTCSNSSIEIAAFGGTTYSWMPGNLNGSNQTIYTATSTTYTVTGTDNNLCTNTSTITITPSTSGILAQELLSNSVAGTSQGSNFHDDGITASYYNGNCDLIASIEDLSGGNILGNVDAFVTVEVSVLAYNNQPYVRRWFEITPNSNGPANVTLYLLQSDFDDYNAANGNFPDLPTSGNNADPNIPNIRITKVDGSLGSGTPIVITPIMNWDATNNWWEASFPVSGFSQFYFHAVNPGNVALPTSINSFLGSQLKDGNLIEWSTSSEKNNDYFNLQYSTDGIHFNVMANIKSKALNGNNDHVITYSALHLDPQQGHNYYRLEQVDIDAHSTINEKVIDLIRNTNGSLINFYPNPTRDFVNVDLSVSKSSNVTIKLMDVNGRIIKQIQAVSQTGNNHFEIDLHSIPSGIYTLQVIENNQAAIVKRFMIGN